MIQGNTPDLRSTPSKIGLPIATLGGAVATIITRWNSAAGQALAGGDWCEVFAISEEVIAATVGDVSGHGEPVADTSAFMCSVIGKAVRQIGNPSEISCSLSVIGNALRLRAPALTTRPRAM